MSINRKLGDLANVLDDGTEGQVLSFNASGKIAASTISTEGTLGTLTQSFDSNQTSSISLSSAANTVPFVSVFKEVPQLGISSKASWDVNSNGTNYEFYDEKPYSSYASSTLTPSATGDGTFTNSNPTETFYDFSNATLGATSTYTAPSQNVLAFSTDGSKLIAFDNGYLKLKSYNLSTAWDISTISSSANAESSISTGDFYGATISADGTKLIGYVNANGYVYEYTMSTPFDVTTLTADGNTNSLGGASTSNAFNWFIKPGTYDTAYAVINRHLYKYTFTGGSIITGTVTRDANFLDLDPGNQKNYINSGQIQFKPDGTEFYIGQGTDSIIEKWVLSTAWDITTASKSSDTAPYTSTGNIWLKPDGENIYYVDDADSNKIKEISIGSTLAFNAADVGKKVVGNSGSAVITGTSGTYKSVTAFADTSAISSWQLFGAEGKADGSGISLTASSAGGFDISGATYTGNTINIQPILNAITGAGQGTDIKGAYIKNDGTMFYAEWYNKYIYQVPLTTAYDITSATSTGGARSNIQLTQVSSIGDIYFKPDGTRIYVADWNYSSSSVSQYDLSTPWDVTSMSYDGEQTFTNSYLRTPYSVFFSADGTKMYTTQTNWSTGNPWFINRVTLSTAWDVTSASQTPDTNQTYNLTNNVSGTVTVYGNGQISPDGTKIVLANRSQSNPQQFILLTMSTPYDLSTISVSEQTVAQNTGSFPTSVVTPDGLKVYMIGNAGTNIYEFDIGEAASINYNSYSPALTSSSNGQINSSTWLDINSMTADETKNDGDIFYAVSTDNRTSWDVAKASDGIRKIARNNSGTWQYNNDAGTNNPWQYNSAAASGNTLTISSAFNYGSWLSGGGTHGNANIKFSPDGTKIFWAPAGGNSDGDDIYTANLSTAWDLSTASQGPVYTEYSSSGYGQASFAFNSDGTKLYTVVRASTGSSARTVRQWSLSTAYDVSTSSYVGASSSIGSYAARGIYVAPDESYFITIDLSSGQTYIKKWNLATAGDITSTLTGETAVDVTSYTNWSAPAVGSFYATTPDFFDSGNKMVILNHGNGGSNTNEAYLVELSTAYDITSGTVIGKFTTATGANSYGVGVKPDGSKLYAVDGTGGIVEFNTGAVQFSTSETWVNGTNNNEHATLQQALTSQAFNRMNKAQLDAVADGYHFSQDSADTLDLMIAPYAASGSSPISDGVTINYDAASKYKQALHGTEYDVEFTSTNSVDLTSKISANLKVRVL